MNENKDDENLKIIKKMYKRFNIIYATDAKMNNDNDVIVICLVGCFEIRDKKTTDLISSNTWLTLDHLDIRGQKIILRFVKESVEFLTANSQTLFESICDVVQRILLPSELEKLNFSKFNAFPVLPTPFSIRKRFSMIKKEKKGGHHDESESKFDDFLKIGSNILDLTEFPKLSKIILDSLPLFNFVSYLIIPELQDLDVYQKLDSILPECPFLRHIKVSNKTDTHFSRFLTTIINSTSKLSSLAFGLGSSLTIDDLKLIRNKIVNSRIHSLELDNSLYVEQNEEISSDFYTLFDGQLGTQLWSFNMKEKMKINFDILLPKLRFITSLSFEDCDIEINKFFTILCQSQMQNLTYLNLNKNDCAEKIPQNLEFPSSLTHISVNDVSWKKNSLVTFFKFFMRQRDGIHLSVSRAQSYREQWDRLFKFLSVSKYNNFRTLVWDRNPICESLLNFLKRNDKLSYLSMSGCFSNNEPDDEKSITLSMFEYIKEAPNLKTLIIKGNDEAYLGEKFPVIVDACAFHPSLSVLDLSFSRCGNVGIGFLIPLIKRGKLNVQTLNIEGCYVSDQDSAVCIKLFKELTESASDVLVSFPIKDDEELFDNKNLKEKQNFQLLFRSKNNFLPKEELESLKDQDKYNFKKFEKSPFYLYPLNHLIPEILFPVFFEETEHKQLILQASKRQKAALVYTRKVYDNDFEEEEEERSESEFAFVNDNDTDNGGMKFSEVPQRVILNNIIKEMPSPKSPDAIASNAILSSEAESQVQQKQYDEDYEYSTYTATATDNYNKNKIKDESIPISFSNSKNVKDKNIEKVSKLNGHNNQNKDENHHENYNNNYVLSEFNKGEIISFKEKYNVSKSIPFPNMKSPSQIMDDKWNQIDESYSLESLYSILKKQRNSIPNK